MPNRLVFAGMAELRAELELVKAEALATEAESIVETRTERARQDIETSYPEVTGNLRKGLSARKIAAGPYAVKWQVKNTANHAWLYDNGSQTVRYYSGTDARGRKFARASRGIMPPNHTFVETMIRQRRAMNEELADLLERHGLVVTGDAE